MSSKKINYPKKNYEYIDFYEVFGITDKTIPTSEIKKIYLDLVVKYHPDRNENNDSSLFELIKRAWETLGNDKSRAIYDNTIEMLNNTNMNDWINLKKNYNDHTELMKNRTVDTSNSNNFKKMTELMKNDSDAVSNQINSKKMAALEFEKSFNDMDQKHKIDRNNLAINSITTEEAKKRFSDMRTLREQDEIEFAQNRIFDEKEGFNEKKFNEVFDKFKEKNTEKNKIIKKTEGPREFNSFEFVDMGSGFSFIKSNKNGDNIDNADDEDEYDEFEGGSHYSRINFDQEININNINDIKNIKLNEHPIDLKKITNEDVEKKINERNTEINIKSINDFNTTDRSFQFQNNLSFVLDNDDNDALEIACNKLLELENRNTKKN